MNLTELGDRQLIVLWADVMAELNVRGLIRSANNPVADYAERVVAERLGLTLAGQSAPGYDATDAAGLRYQIKGLARIIGCRSDGRPGSDGGRPGAHNAVGCGPW